MTSSLFVRLMQAAFTKFLEAMDEADREAALDEMAALIRRNYRGDLGEEFDSKMAQAGKDE